MTLTIGEFFHSGCGGLLYFFRTDSDRYRQQWVRSFYFGLTVLYFISFYIREILFEVFDHA